MAFSLRPMDGVFYELFNEMAVHLVGGSALLAEMLAEGTDRAAKAKEMREAESVADATTRAIIAQGQQDLRDAVRPRGHLRARQRP